MKAIDPNTLPERENYKFLTGSIIPRPIAFITTLSETGVVNAAPFSYFNIISANPPMISVSIQRIDGNMKDTARNAIERREFVVHIVDEFYIEQMNITARPLPPDESEVIEAGLNTVDSKKIHVPGIKEAKIRFECVLEKAISFGETETSEPTCDLLIGRIVQYHINEELYDAGRIDPDELKPVSRLAGNYYAKLGEKFEVERPL